jgi:hypothetical protein
LKTSWKIEGLVEIQRLAAASTFWHLQLNQMSLFSIARMGVEGQSAVVHESIGEEKTSY